MKDEEFIMLRNRVLLGLGISILFCTPLFLIFYNRWNVSSNAVKKIETEQEVVFLIVSKNCPECKEIKKELNKHNVIYTTINSDKDKDYNRLINKLNIISKDIKAPTIIYVKDQELVSTLVQKDSEEVAEFINYYQLQRE